jgi:SAM-dependent methyltransferase
MFVDHLHLPAPDEERERYAQHQNSIHNHGYVAFLNTAVNAALPFLRSEMSGLDFGCGPNPVLSELLKGLGFHCSNYDPFFFPEKPTAGYDFIFATECLEHFHYPEKDILNIASLLRNDGILTIMTSFWNEDIRLKDWHYLRDRTHVSIFHLQTVRYMEDAFNLEVLHTDKKRIVVFRKK